MTSIHNFRKETHTKAATEMTEIEKPKIIVREITDCRLVLTGLMWRAYVSRVKIKVGMQNFWFAEDLTVKMYAIHV